MCRKHFTHPVLAPRLVCFLPDIGGKAAMDSSDPGDKTARRIGRRPGAGDARNEILAAARKQFQDHGFAGATVRAIAAEAGVDPSLVIYFFGTKKQLFGQAIRAVIDPMPRFHAALDAADGDLAESIVRGYLGLWSSPEIGPMLQASFRSLPTLEQAEHGLRSFLENIVVPEAQTGAAVPPDPDRIRLVIAELFGVAVVRHVIGAEPIASMSEDDLIAHVTPGVRAMLNEQTKRS